jgi:demethylmenaquinone methyltransferase/2-methoxy-6-polyprenyl-1,4-benzoquinol methylase
MLGNPLPTVRTVSKDSTTHFGYETVSLEDKAGRVRGVFDSVASRYDLMNDLMSGGLHRLWKRFTIEQAGVRRGQAVLDLAGGTGDLAGKFASQVGSSGHVVLADINASMLRQGRRRLIDRGVAGNLSIVQVDAEKLPFTDASFDCITIAFGLRNVTAKDTALASMLRVLKPGGKLLILEFSKPSDAIKPVYDLYSFNVLPLLGKLVASDSASYQYLAESIRMHPDQETLTGMMRDAGFERCRYHNLAGGIVALHIGYKI